MHGTRAANYAMDEADLICAVGARFDDRITGKLSEFAPRAKFITIDIDPAEISKNVPDPHTDRGQRQERAGEAGRRVPHHERRRIAPGGVRGSGSKAGAPKTHPLSYEDTTDSEIKPQYMVQALYEATGGERDRDQRRGSASARCR